jgi:hypothetical protein
MTADQPTPSSSGRAVVNMPGYVAYSEAMLQSVPGQI